MVASIGSRNHLVLRHLRNGTDRRAERREADIHRIAAEIALMHPQPMLRKRKPISTARFQLRANNKPSPGNSAPP